MKVKVYMRVAQLHNGRPKVAAATKPNLQPLQTTSYVLPTAMFAIELEIPRALFDRASQVLAQVTIPDQAIEVIAEVVE